MLLASLRPRRRRRPFRSQSPVGKGPRDWAASVLQAGGFRGDAAVFRLNEWSRPKTRSEPAFLRNTAAGVYTIEAAHNPEAQVQILPPLLKTHGNGAFLFSRP